MNDTPPPTNLIALLDRLVEPPMPEPVSMLPQTAGWWVLGGMVLLAVAVGLWCCWQIWRANGYRRAALRALARAQDDPAQIATVLRRAALAAYPRDRVAGLTGRDWIAFLQTTGTFPDAAAEPLLRGPYAPGIRATGLRAAARSWLRTHRRMP